MREILSLFDLFIFALLSLILFFSCDRFEEDFAECTTKLDCAFGFICVDGFCVEDEEEQIVQDNNTNELPEQTIEEPDDQIEEEPEEEPAEEPDEIEVTDEVENEISDEDSGGGSPFGEVICTEEAECDENSVCYNEDGESTCVNPYKKYWKVSIDTLCLSDKKPDGDDWDGVDLIDKPDPYAILYVNGMEVMKTSYADEQLCAHYQNYTNIRFAETDIVKIKMMEYDSLIFNDDDYVGEIEWTEGIPVEVFKDREYVFDDSSNPGYNYLRVTIVEME